MGPPPIAEPTAEQAQAQAQAQPHGWGPYHDKLLKEWRTRAFVENYLQTYSMYAYQKYNNYLSLPAVVLSTISGASIFSSNSTGVKYMAASMTLFSGILSGMMRQIQPGERSEKHYVHAKRWGTLIRHIQHLLATPVNQRDRIDLIINQIMSEIESIESSQPHPAPGALHKFHQQFGRRNFDIHMYGEDVINTIYKYRQPHLSQRDPESITVTMANTARPPSPFYQPPPLTRQPTAAALASFSQAQPRSPAFGVRPTAIRDRLSQLIAANSIRTSVELTGYATAPPRRSGPSTVSFNPLPAVRTYIPDHLQSSLYAEGTPSSPVEDKEEDVCMTIPEGSESEAKKLPREMTDTPVNLS